MEWVEAVGKTVDEAVDAALSALGQTSKDSVDIEVIDEGKKGILGLGGRDAKVKVSIKPNTTRSRKKRRNRGKGRSSTTNEDDIRQPRKSGGRESRGESGGESGGESRDGKRRPAGEKAQGKGRTGQNRDQAKKVVVDKKPEDKPSIEEQADVARDFAEGLLKAFGLEGDVTTRIEDDILFIDIAGEQTEALVGRKGAVVQAVHELTRTVIQRKTYGAPRMRLDIAGYAARRREALGIYATRLAETVKEDGREAMLEPMNAADRKVVHDAIAEIDGVRSYSEGEDPNRSVIVAPDD